MQIKVTENVSSTLKNMNEKELKKLMKSGVSKAARTVTAQIRSAYKGTGRRYTKKSGYSNPAAGITGRQDKKDVMSIVFSILKDFRLKWFEYGTQERMKSKTRKHKRKSKIKKPIKYSNKPWGKKSGNTGNTGKIKAKPFFIPTIKSLKNDIIKIYTDSFDFAINRIINKNN